MSSPQRPEKPLPKGRGSVTSVDLACQSVQTEVTSKPQTDWIEIRRQYIKGPDATTYLSLSRQPHAPKERAIESRARRENWTNLRADFRRELTAKTRALDLEVQHEVQKAATDTRRQHVKLGTILLSLAARGTAHIKVEELGDLGVTRLARAGAEIQRKALGLEETTVNIRTTADLKRLSDAELLELARIATAESDSEHAADERD